MRFHSEIFETPCRYTTHFSNVIERDYEAQTYLWLQEHYPNLIDSMRGATRLSFKQEKDLVSTKNLANEFLAGGKNDKRLDGSTFTPEPGAYWFYENKSEVGPESFEFFHPGYSFTEE